MKSFIDRFLRSLSVFQELLEQSECDNCKVLQGQLEYERDRTTHLLDLLSPRMTMTNQRAVGTKSWSTLQNELERKNLKAINEEE